MWPRPHPALLITIAIPLAGCDQVPAPSTTSKPPPSSPTRSPAAAPPTPAPADALPTSDPTIATLAAAGIRTPPLRLIRTVPSHRLVGFDVPPRQAFAEWQRLRAATEGTGLYPLIYDPHHGHLDDLAEEAAPAADILAQAAQIDIPRWVQRRHEEDPELMDSIEYGEWPDSAEGDGAEDIPFDAAEKPSGQSLLILLLPTRNPWEACAYVPFGGWNACPSDHEHVAIHKYWFEKHGAEPAYMTGDVLQFTVARPPTDRTTSDMLAREQCLYTAGDLVTQGTETLANLSAALLNGRAWFFWWD